MQTSLNKISAGNLLDMGKRRQKPGGCDKAWPTLVLPCDLPTWPTMVELLVRHDKPKDVFIIKDSINNRSNLTDLFDDFRFIIDQQFSTQQRIRFLTKTLPCMAKYAICINELRPSSSSSRPFSILIDGCDDTLSLDRRFVASLISNAIFFSTFPVRAECLQPKLADLSFGSMFNNIGISYSQGMRLKNLLNYFDTLSEEEPCGRISYSRKPKKQSSNGCGHWGLSSEAETSLMDLAETLMATKDRKPLTPVFVLSESRGIDINNNTSEIRLCNFSDKLLFDEDVAKVVQHPEILISLMFIEKADPNDWIEFTGILTSRIPLSPLNHKDELQICFVDKESSQEEDKDLLNDDTLRPFMMRELWRYHECFNVSNFDQKSKNDIRDVREGSQTMSSKSSKLDRLAEKCSSPESDISLKRSAKKEKRQKMTPDQKFSERLKAALARGNTPDFSSQDGEDRKEVNSNFGLCLERTRRVVHTCQADPSLSRDPDSDSDDDLSENMSMDSSESLELGFDIDSDFKDILQEWMQFADSLPEDELEFQNKKSTNRKRVVRCIAKSLRRRSLSESLSENTFRFEQIAHGIKCKAGVEEEGKCSKLSTSFTVPNFGLEIERNSKISFSKVQSTDDDDLTTKPCLWIISQTNDIDPSRFLVQWLAASLNDIPLILYQTRLVHLDEEEFDFGADVVASICSGVEDRGWDAKELLKALLDGKSNSLFEEQNPSDPK